MKRSASWYAAVLGALLSGACGRCGPWTSTPVANEVTDAAVPDASHDATDATDATLADATDAQADATDAGATCGPTLLQPTACVTAHADLVLGDAAIHAWFAARDTTIAEYTFEQCREVVFGPAAEHVLVCVDMRPIAIDMNLGIVGPVEHRYDLDVVASRGKRRVELLRVPLAFGMNSTDYSMYAEMLFAARFTVDAAAGTIDVVATPEECEAALGMLKPYWFAKNEELRANDGLPPLMKRQLTEANDLERRSDAERIAATCRAAGRYVLGRDGRLGKIRK